MDETAVGMALSSIRAAVDDLKDTALWSRLDAQAIGDARSCWTLLQQLEAVHATMIADLESRVLPDGLTTKAFLQTALHRTVAQAAGDVRAAMNPLPKSAQVFAAGLMSRAHLDVIVKTTARIPDELRYSECQRTRSCPCGRTGEVPAGGQFISLSAVS